MPYHAVDAKKIKTYPLQSRKSKSSITEVAIDPQQPRPCAIETKKNIRHIVEHIRNARKKDRAVILAFGAHLVKNGLGPVVIKLLKEGWITHIASNGAGTIHDWEFSWLGRSEEDVRENVAKGCFGTWTETGKYINLAVQAGALEGMGYGESIGAEIWNEELQIPTQEELLSQIQNGLAKESPKIAALAELLQTIRSHQITAGTEKIPHPFKHYSIFGNAYALGIPATIHPGIGYDIIYNNPFANGAAIGRAAHHDFKIMVNSVQNLNDGVFLSVGSAIMAPQIFEKALSFANNLAIQEGKPIIHNHLLIVNDLQKSEWDWSQGEPPKESPDYYFRFLKSFYRMGGAVRYIAEDNRNFLVNLYQQLNS